MQVNSIPFTKVSCDDCSRYIGNQDDFLDIIQVTNVKGKCDVKGMGYVSWNSGRKITCSCGK